MAEGVSGQTLSPRKALGRYQQHVWQDQHGLPQNTVYAITRTRDGYLWLGTVEGLARFDGVRFTVFDSANTPQLRSNQILALLEDRAGSLWIGTHGGGLNRYQDGRFTLYTTAEGLSNDRIKSLLEDRAGNLWVGTEGGGLNLFRDGRFTAYTTREGLPHNQVWALAEDGAGGLWVGTQGGLARFHDRRFNVWTTRDGLPHDVVRALCRDRDGNLWVGTDGGGLTRFKEGRFNVYGKQDGLMNDSVWAITEDREGHLWIGTGGSGLSRLKDGRFSSYTAREGLPEDNVTEIYQDPEGDLWIGTYGGASQLRDGRFRVYTTQDGLPHDYAGAIYEDGAGNLWVGTDKGLSWFKDGQFTNYTMKVGLPENNVGAIGEDRAGNLWLSLGAYRGAGQFRDGQLTTYTTKDGLSDNDVYSILGDRAGNVWLGTYGGGLNLFRDGRFTPYRQRDGLADDFVLCLYEDRAGSLWIGTLGGGISRLKDGRFTNWNTKDGLANNHVLSFYEDSAGSLWVGTHGGGLSRFKDGKFTTISVKDGLYDNLAFQILEDDAGNLWMSCNKGIYRAILKELNDFADGRITFVTSFSYGVADGMLSRECNGASPAGWKTRDGRLWFPTVKGVVVVDTRERNTQPPMVAIEEVTLDREALPAGEPVRINPGQGNLEIKYTGISWSRPGQIRFKYQLMGLDQDWVEAGTRRTAYFSYLLPGDYTFRVIADNGEGVWNTVGQSLRVVVLPPFYRTWWFLTATTLSVLALAFFAYHYRIGQLQRQQAAQQAFSRQLIASQESERKRIATELHDGLGQNLLIIKNRAVIGLRNDGDNRAAQEQLGEITESISQAIQEVRTITYNLRPFYLDNLGLTASLEDMIEKLGKTSGIQFTADINSIDSVFAKEEEINFYRIAQECANNIVKHSGATRASMEIWQEANALHFTARDNGCGFAPDELARDGRRRGLGLTGISERVQMLGGSHTIDSILKQGTIISIRIPVAGKK